MKAQAWSGLFNEFWQICNPNPYADLSRVIWTKYNFLLLCADFEMSLPCKKRLHRKLSFMKNSLHMFYFALLPLTLENIIRGPFGKSWLEAVCGVVQVISIRSLGSNPSSASFWLYELGQSRYPACKPQFPHLQDKDWTCFIRLFSVVRAELVKLHTELD